MTQGKANFNLDKFLRAKKSIRLAGIDIDITKVPLIVNASLDQIYKEMQDIATREKNGETTEQDATKGAEIIEKLISMFLIVVNRNDNKPIDREWVLNHCDNFDVWNFLSVAANKDNMIAQDQPTATTGDVKKKRGRGVS